MNSLIKTIILSVIVFTLSCTGNDSYYRKITKVKTINERLSDLNKSLTEIRKSEKKASLTKEEEDYLEFEYKIGENESYKTTYFFDDSGCYEVGLDTYFTLESTAKEVLNEIKTEIEKDANFGPPTNTNSLYEWNSKDGLITIELDYMNQDKGMIRLTSYANQ